MEPILAGRGALAVGRRAEATLGSTTGYIALCSVLGLVLGWAPLLLHGPIAAKWDLYGLHGPSVMWAFYLDRMLIGFLVGITAWPARWYLRGPLCGLVLMLPLGFVSLANAYCGPP